MDRAYEGNPKSNLIFYKIIFKNLPFTFSAFVKVENLKRDLTHSEESQEKAKESHKIISNPKEYAPRKISANEEYKELQFCKDSNTYSKFDKHDPHYGYTKPVAYVHNKYDFVNDPNTFKHNPKKEKRSKAYSIHENYYQPHAFIPLNKNYNLDNIKTIPSNIFINIKYLVEYKYSFNDISRIFINMNLMKKFEMPEFLENVKVSEIFNEKPKSSLVIFQAKKEHVEVRERAYTFHDKPKSNNLINIL
jgi:hypothetical protein